MDNYEINQQLLREITTNTNVINDCKLRIETLQSNIASLEATEKQLTDSTTLAGKELADAQAVADAAKKDCQGTIASLNAQITALEEKIKASQDSVDSLNTKLSELRTTATDETKAYEKMHADHVDFMTQANTEKATVNVELATATDALKTQRVEYATLIDKSNTLAADTGFAEANLETLKTQTAEAQKNLDGIIEKTNTTISQAEIDIAALRDKNATEISEHETKLTALKAEVEVVEKDLSNKQALAVSLADKEVTLDQRENYLREKYKTAGIQW